MSTVFTLEPLLVGMLPAFPLTKFLEGYHGDATVDAPCISWLARGSDGTAVLVDTGPAPRCVSTFPVVVEEHHRIDQALNAAGVDPAEITAVVYTHLHWDHCAGAENLPNARIFVQERELQFAVSPPTQFRRGYEVGTRGTSPSWMPSFDRIEPVTGDIEVSPGFRMVSLPGHTPGSAGVIFQGRTGRYAVVGDLVNQIENWEGTAESPGHIAPSLHASLEDCHTAFAKLDQEADIVLASHDARMLDRAVY
ncbi:N-acyl homoserine lactonase family protein [Amycolatopsis pithecellobii]|uniref:MBL fold metallo-hydrolase n=1 Tax=Amycolatopsis pithecellobii TaxID=664692 RepID=A0A6N7Z790_9PSEU|nr:N-acyl homoserine lactonase family protein [Amycolatopsis pithecellobii]MTD58019.1 MBL fold metallo-hydrolase [Amycolatopsis pithecellobii]